MTFYINARNEKKQQEIPQSVMNFDCQIKQTFFVPLVFQLALLTETINRTCTSNMFVALLLFPSISQARHKKNDRKFYGLKQFSSVFTF